MSLSFLPFGNTRKANVNNNNVKWIGNFTDMQSVNNNAYMKILIIPQIHHELKYIQNYELIGDIKQDGQVILFGSGIVEHGNKMSIELTCNLIDGKLYGTYILKIFRNDNLKEYIYTSVVNDGMIKNKLVVLKDGDEGPSSMFTYVEGNLTEIINFHHATYVWSIIETFDMTQFLYDYYEVLNGYITVSTVDINYRIGVSTKTYLTLRGHISHVIKTVWNPTKHKQGQFQYYYVFDEHEVISKIVYQDNIDPLITDVFSESIIHVTGTINRFTEFIRGKYSLPELPSFNNKNNVNTTKPTAYMGEYQVNGMPMAPIVGINIVPFKYEHYRRLYTKNGEILITYNNDGDIKSITGAGIYFIDYDVRSFH